MKEKQEKEQFFAQYWGQKILRVSSGAIVEQIIDSFFMEKFAQKEDSYLLLKDLKNISDEDAIEVAKILSMSSSVYLAFEDTKWKVDRKNSDNQVWVHNGKDPMAIAFINYHGRVYFNVNGGTTRLFCNDLNAYDYLRSKGYALPFRQYSVEQMIEMNWIKLTEK